MGNETRYIYDKNNRLIATIDPEGHTTSQSYDDVGNIIAKTNGRNITTTYRFDEFNRLAEVINPKSEKTTYTYDLNGNKLTQTDGNGNITSYEYNATNKVIRKIDQGGRIGTPGKYTYLDAKTEKYTYFADGSMETKIDRNGKQTVYTYDIHGRLTRKAIGEVAIRYTYDDNDNQLTMSDKTGTTTRTYDEENRVTTKKAPGFGTTTYTYDNVEGGGLYSETTEDFKHNLTKKVYDKAGRLYQVISDGKTTTYEYYGNGSRKTVTYSDGAKEEYTYYKNGLNKSLTNKKADGTVIDTYSYTYDEAHNQTTKTDRKGTTSYNYDSLNRLEKVTEPNGRVTNYTFDKAGNRLTEIILSGAVSVTTTYTYNEQNKLVSTVKRSGTETITDTYRFDSNGNTVSKTTETVKPVATSASGGFSLEKSGQSTTSNVTYYKFDVWNQLVKTTAGKKTATYSYNGEGYRVSKTENERTTNYLYEADKVVLETDVEGNETARNIYGTNLLTRTAQNDTMNYMYNGHGDVTALIGENGAIQATYYYDAFGNITEQTGDVNNSITYAGYQYDKETDLYYLNARYSDSKTARFLTEDTYTGDPNDPLSLNLYTYCANEPVMYVDPSGHRTLEQGMSGDDVRNMQTMLITLGYKGENGNDFKATGYFGTDTLAALNKYKDKILPAGNRGSNRGLAGDTTLAYLNYSYNMQYANSLTESNSRAYATNNTKYTFNQQMSNVKSSNLPNKPVAPKPNTNSGTTANLKGSGESASSAGNPVCPIWQKSDEDYSMMIQNLLLQYTIKWYVASNPEEKDDLVSAANKIRNNASEGAGWWLEHVKEFTEGTLDLLNGLVGTPESISKFQRDELLKVVSVFNDITISNSKNNIRQGMGFVVGLFTGTSEEKIALKGATSLIKESNTLIKAAEKAGSNEAVQREINSLAKQFLSGNSNPGIGSKHLANDIYYLRGREGSRVFYRVKDGVFEILGKASKENEQQVIDTIKKLYK